LISSRAARAAAVAGACVFAALVVTWPLALHVADAVPRGAEGEGTTQFFNLYVLWWNAHSAARGFLGYWDAPFFFPNPGVLAYSEPQPVTGLLAAPFFWLGAPPALAYNVALLATLVLNGVFAARVARALGVSTHASLLCAVLMVALPFTAKEVGVLHQASLWGVLWCVEGLVRFREGAAWRSALWAAAGFAVAYGTCQQYALLFAPFAVAGGLVALAGATIGTGATPEPGSALGRARAALRLGAAGAGTGLVVLLFAWPALRVQDESGFHRSEKTVETLSAEPGDFFQRPATASLGVPPRGRHDRGGLFPGALLALLALAGMYAGTRDRATRAWTLFLCATAAAAALLALGLHLDVFGWRPFQTLRLLAPFERLRSPYRFAALAHLALPLLAALALHHLERGSGSAAHLERGWAAHFAPAAARRRWSTAALTALGLLAAAENLAVPVPLTPVPRSARTAWTEFLRAQPEGTAAAHVPFPAGLLASDYEIETRRMFHAMDHEKPLVNGYSGYFPQLRGPDGRVVHAYTQFQLAMARDFPTLPLLCTLAHGLDATHLVADRAWLDAHRAAMDAHAAYLSGVFTDGEVVIYKLAVPRETCLTPATRP
jgi:hypothetical protein